MEPKMTRKNKIYQTDSLFLENIIADLPGVIFWKDVNSVYLGCNDVLVKIFGVKSREDVIGKTDFDFGWGKEQAQRVVNDDLEVIRTGIPKQNIYERVPLPNGEYLDMLTNKVPLYDRNDQIIGVLGTATDITEQKKVEMKLENARQFAEQASQSKSNFLATMSHELRTPLNGILGMTQVLLNESVSEKQKEHLETIQQSGKNLLALISDVLDFSRLEAGQVELHSEEFSPVVLMKEIKMVMQHVIQGKPVELKAEVDLDIPEYLLGDVIRLRQIIINLVGNAVKFTLQGHVKIKLNLASKTDEIAKLEIMVEDTGIGIPADKLNSIFERFTQVESEYGRRFEGSGLGLSIVKNLVEMMGGTIQVQSEFGVGSRFSCVLPFTIIDKNNDGPIVDAAKSLHAFDKNTQFECAILVVEDNPINQTVMRAMLSNLGCKVDVAGNGKDSLKLSETNAYDLIFMDLGLPDMDGLQVTKSLLKSEKKLKRKPIPIVGLTAHVMEDDRKNCLDAGMIEVLTKPIVYAQLVELLKKFIKPSKISI
jgi:two-component system, OmpR family, aerobic respiration control sensor histidine kinase ArcB